MKAIRTICTLMIVAMCSCSGPVSEKQDTKQSEVKAQEQNQAIDAKAITSEPGIIFYDLTLERALEKAKSEGKYVFIDCKSKSCGPCRKMEKDVFPREKLGKFVNERFVPIMSDMEEGNGPEIAKKYKVQIYPTILILRPDALKEGEITGAEYDIDILIGMLKDIIHEK